MRLSFIASCVSLFLAVQSLVIEQRSCVSPDVITIAQQVTHPHYFCAWYLSEYVILCPIQKLDTNLRTVVEPDPQFLTSTRMHY